MLKVTANQNKNNSCKMCNSLALVMGEHSIYWKDYIYFHEYNLKKA